MTGMVTRVLTGIDMRPETGIRLPIPVHEH